MILWLTISIENLIFLSLKLLHMHLCAASLSWSKSGGNMFQYMWWVPSPKKRGLLWANQDEKEISLLVEGVTCWCKKNALCVCAVWWKWEGRKGLIFCLSGLSLFQHDGGGGCIETISLFWPAEDVVLMRCWSPLGFLQGVLGGDGENLMEILSLIFKQMDTTAQALYLSICSTSL